MTSEHDETTKALIEAALAWDKADNYSTRLDLMTAVRNYIAAHPAPKLCKNCGKARDAHVGVFGLPGPPWSCPLTWSDPDE
jgi:hypothetical protein